MSFPQPRLPAAGDAGQSHSQPYSQPQYSIAAVESSTGISKETLRAWERRYGFPMPVRDAEGERLYNAQQLQQLREAKQLIDRGARPGQIFANGALQATPAQPPSQQAYQRQLRFADGLSLLEQFRIDELAAGLQGELLNRGLPTFTCEVLAPLVRTVGEAWQAGRITVAAEHLFTARVIALMQTALLTPPVTTASPLVLCATLAGERHGLGLLMAQAMLRAQGLRCIDLGTDLPLADIAAAARMSGADIVMLSFSGHFAHRQVPGLLSELLAALPERVEVWTGGAGARSVRSRARLRCAQKLEDIPAWVADWRATRQQPDTNA